MGVICYRSHLLGEPETIIENGWEVQLLQNWDKSAYTLDLARPHPRHRCEWILVTTRMMAYIFRQPGILVPKPTHLWLDPTYTLSL